MPLTSQASSLPYSEIYSSELVNRNPGPLGGSKVSITLPLLVGKPEYLHSGGCFEAGRRSIGNATCDNISKHWHYQGCTSDDNDACAPTEHRHVRVKQVNMSAASSMRRTVIMSHSTYSIFATRMWGYTKIIQNYT